MARTLGLNLTGRAAATYLADEREYLRDVANPNSYIWKHRLERSLEKFNDVHWIIWESPFVPETASYHDHYEWAEAILTMV